MQQFPIKLQDKLDKREKENILTSLPNDDNLVDFSSDDYLGFAVNETIFANTFQLLLNKGNMNNGASGSRLFGGNHDLYKELETYLASNFKAKKALVFNSGHSAHQDFFSAVSQSSDIILFDEHIQPSIKDGIELSPAKSHKFRHNDLGDLVKKCEASNGKGYLYVVTESVFSLDGDSPDLKTISKICKTFKAKFVVDEAHAVGVCGKKGIGLIPFYSLESEVFARFITFGKAIGSYGAAILGSERLVEYLVNYARSFVYTTALPPHTLATTLSAIAYGNSELATKFSLQLKENIDYFNQKVKSLKLDSIFIPSNSAIQCCRVSGDEIVKKAAKKLQDKGFRVYPVQSPTVPQGEERLRFCIHSYNTKEEIGLVLQILSSII